MSVKKLFLATIAILLPLFTSAQTYEIKGVTYPIPEAVDLGLPSGNLWANMNIGASAVNDPGGYYGWADPTGELTTDDYYWRTPQLDGPWNSPLFGGTNPPQDISGTELDIATIKLGDDWCMPSPDDFQELTDYCSFSVSDRFVTVTGHNGNSIILPLTGMYCWHSTGPADFIYGQDMEWAPCFWASTRSDHDKENNYPAAYYACAQDFGFCGAEGACDSYFRNSMMPIRAIQRGNNVIPDNGGMCGKNVIWSFNSSTHTLTISGTGKMYDLPSDDLCQFENIVDMGIENIIIESGVTSIGDYCFCLKCGGKVKNVSIANTVTSIGECAFHFFDSLPSVKIPNSVKSIKQGAFEYCRNLTSIEIPSSVNIIEEGVFGGCNNLTNVKVLVADHSEFCNNTVVGYISKNTKGNVVLIDKNNNVIKDFIIPDDVTNIGNCAFSGCTELASVTIPNSVTTIDSEAFKNCSSLKSVNIPNSVTSIGTEAFSSCSGLTSVTIPNSVTTIGDYAFAGCTGLKAIYIPNSIACIGSNAFEGCNINTLRIDKEAITEPDINAFTGNPITEVIIGNNTKTIEENAFSALSKTILNVTIGSSVESIKTRAFTNFDNLETFTCKATTIPTTHRTAFENSYTADYVDLYVPQESVEAYSTTAPWKDFKSINGMVITKYTLIYLVDNDPYKSYQYEEGDPITPEPAPTRDGYSFSGWSGIPATMPASDVTVTGTFTKLKCSTPTIDLTSGKIVFSCDTPDVEYHYTITSAGASSGIGNNIPLSSTYTVTVYATRENYDDSDPATIELHLSQGDLNGDGSLSISDAVGLIQMILNKTE